MNFIYVIKRLIIRGINDLKYDKAVYKLFLLNIFFTLAWIVFFVFNIFHIDNKLYNEVAIIFCIGLLFLITALPYIFTIKCVKNVGIDKDGVIKNFVEMLMLELREPLSFAKLQSEILNEILANMEKRKTDVINLDEHYQYCLNHRDYDSFKKITKISGETSQYGIDLIENYTISFREPESNHQAIIKEFPIKGAIDKAITICSVPFPEVKNIEIDIEDFCVKSNFNYVKHVMINLIKNAYIHNGRDVKLRINGNRRVLYIADYGQGIKKNMIKSIFNKFYSRHRGGVGMGLYFCRYAMEKIGGSIQCESVEGQYTKFILDFSRV